MWPTKKRPRPTIYEMIILLADSNSLRHSGLQQFLKASCNHAIGVSDLTIIEMEKKNALKTSRMSLRTVFLYPKQCFALKRTDLLLDNKVHNLDDAIDLIDYGLTANLRELATNLWCIPVPTTLPIERQHAEGTASLIISNLRIEVAGWEQEMVAAVSIFSSTEISEIRGRKDVRPETVRKTIDLLLDTTRDFMLRNQQKKLGEQITVKDAMSMFGFRYSLCVMLYTLSWIREGSSTGKNVEKRLNDAIDLQVAAAGTFFNGVLSTDKQVKWISSQARRLLRDWGAYVGEDLLLFPP